MNRAGTHALRLSSEEDTNAGKPNYRMMYIEIDKQTDKQTSI